MERRVMMPVYWHKRARPGTTIKWSNASSPLLMGLTRNGMWWRANDIVAMFNDCRQESATRNRRSTHSRSARRSGEILRLKLCLGSCESVALDSPLSTGYPGCPSSSSIGLMHHLHFIATDNWCRAVKWAARLPL